MKLMAIIQGGVIVNTAIWDGAADWNPGQQFLLEEITNVKPQPGIGWTHVSPGVYSAPVASLVKTLDAGTDAQALRELAVVLIQKGILTAGDVAAINQELKQ